jgi:hypothetical protein
MTDLGTYLLWVHLLAASLWFGGAAFLLLVVAPAGRFTMPLAERALYFRRLDRGFDSIAYGAVAMLFFSGTMNWLGSGRVGPGSYWALLGTKVLLALGMVSFRVVRSARIGPGLAVLAAEGIGGGPGDSSEELESVWGKTVFLLALEVISAVPVVFLGVVLRTT